MNMDLKDHARLIAQEGHSVCPFVQQSFDRDFNVFMTVRKMVDRYLRSGTINERLLINNVVLCLNTFGAMKTNRVYRTIMDDSQFAVVKAVLVFLCQSIDVIGFDVIPDRVMTDVLAHVSLRYNLSHL